MGTYEDSGVSIVRGNVASNTALELLRTTFNDSTELVDGLVLLDLDLSEYREPRFGISVDGAGTKLKYAFASGQHSGVGMDLVAMCVNDLARNNLKPLGFGMYFATGKLYLSVHRLVVAGTAKGCRIARCVYMGGETAEMPGIYQEGEYDIAGFAFGVVDRSKRITGKKIREGDVVFAITSSGLHSNGFSKVRELLPPETLVEPAFTGVLADILRPTRIYVDILLQVNQRFPIHGWAHITGGGVYEKLGKIIPDGLAAELKRGSWEIPLIFRLISDKGDISEFEMFSTFNMGLGMVGVASARVAKAVIKYLIEAGYRAFEIGRIVPTKIGESVSLT